MENNIFIYQRERESCTDQEAEAWLASRRKREASFPFVSFYLYLDHALLGGELTPTLLLNAFL